MTSSTLQTPLRIAIIGGGFSGAMVATHLLRRSTDLLTITLIESRPHLGRGIAYSTDLECHLLNVPAGRMSAFPDDPQHFTRWLPSWDADGVGYFVPRNLYGTYIQAVLEMAITQAPAHVRLERICSDAVALLPEGSGATVHLRNGQTIPADRVVLALGNLPPSDPEVADRSFYQSQRYISHPWASAVLDHLEPTAPVLLIGSGLTMVDLVLALKAQDHQGIIHVISRHGWLPQSHRGCATYPKFLTATETPATVRVLLRRIRQEAGRAAVAGYDWRAVIDALRPETQALWQALSLAERRRFLRHVRSYWDVHRHRAAPKAAASIEQLRQSEQLHFHAGRICAYQEQDDGVWVTYRPRQGHTLASLQVSRVINCTGPDGDYRKLQQPLILNLLASGLIRPDPLCLGLDTDAEGRLLNARGGASSFLYTLGPPCKGRLWETTAVPEIRGQAEALARRLLQTGCSG
jgi:uncharacterized NAD(P)/FAD-binding protein YdhS